MLSYCQILVDGELAFTIDGSDAGTILTGGRVTVAEGVVRRTATFNLADPAGNLAPVMEKGLLIPRSCEIRAWAGVRYWDYTPGEWTPNYVIDGDDKEFVPIFTGPITSVDLSDYPSIVATCSDRMWYCQQPFSAPYTVVAGQTLDDAISSLLTAKVPPSKLDIDLPTTNLTASLLIYDEQADPASKLQELATAAGWTLYCDPFGTFTAGAEPELDPENVDATYQAGPGGMLIQPKVSYDSRNIINTWVVTGESAGDGVAAASAKVVDDDPNSPLYVRGTFDEQPRFISSPLMTTDAQALLAAKTYRARERGLSSSVVATVFPDASREKGDVYQVTGGLVSSLLLADAFDYELTGAPQDITARPAVPDVVDGT